MHTLLSCQESHEKGGCACSYDSSHWQDSDQDALKTAGYVRIVDLGYSREYFIANCVCECREGGEAISEVETGETKDDDSGDETANIMISDLFLGTFKHQVLILRISPLIFFLFNLAIHTLKSKKFIIIVTN